MNTSIHYSNIIFKIFLVLKLHNVYNHIVIKHLMTIIISAFTFGYKGKIKDFANNSENHRTTIAHFLNAGKWDHNILLKIKKQLVLKIIYREAKRSKSPIYVITDDTGASKTQPSSKAVNPIENAYFYQSNLKKKQDYGHQAVAVMLSCNGITLNYDWILYTKNDSKIKIVERIAEELPIPPVISYWLCDSWYTSSDLIRIFLKKGFHTISALKTNRIIFPNGIKQKIKEFATHIEKTDAHVSLVTVGKKQYYVYRYEGKLKDSEEIVVLITYSKNNWGKIHALRAFISTDISLSTKKILEKYTIRWSIEVFFRQIKNTLAMNKYQIRKTTGINRYWLIMSFVHVICCLSAKDNYSFLAGYQFLSQQIKKEQISYIYNCGKNNIPLDKIFKSLL